MKKGDTVSEQDGILKEANNYYKKYVTNQKA